MKYIQIHELISYPASNLNRDDLGRPKTVKIGESTRLRISSQSLKRAWRVSDVMTAAFPEMGIRTRKLEETIAIVLKKGYALPDYIKGHENIVRNPVDSELAKKYGKEIDDIFRNNNKSDEGDGKKDEKESKEKKKQILHYSSFEINKVDGILEQISLGEEPKIDEFYMNKQYPVDISMFGRMVANDPINSCEASVQVAHAFTVHKATIEEDYFTVVDDLNTGSDTGAGHLGETSFGAGLFYNYICVDFELLCKNLGSKELANDAVKKLIEVSSTVSPTGKQNSFASRAYASYIMIEKGSKQPRSLSSAFLKPVSGDDLLVNAIKRINETQSNMNKVYGKCYDDCYVMDVTTGEGSLESVGAFLE